MSVIGSNILAGASGQAGYFLTNSLRFRASASAYLNRTLGTPTDNKKFTWSAWVKRGSVTAAGGLFDAYLNGVNFSSFYFQSNGTIQFYNIIGGADSGFLTTPVYRDPSAWYHIVFVYDSANATAADRGIIYVNSVRQTVTNPYDQIGLNEATYLNNVYPNYIGRQTDSGLYFDGYIAELNFVDGQALTPSSFGETSTSTGVWIPKKYTGTYGTNGFYLPFTDNSALTTSSNVGLGKDFSGNANYFVTNNISITAGTTYDSMTDVPTLTSATAANYATINALDYNSTYLTLNDGNLHQTYAGVVAAAASRATMVIPTTGKYYWEVYINATGGGAGERIRVGITSPTTAISGNSIDGSATSYLQMSNGQKRNNSTDSTYGSGFSATQIIQVLYDATAGAIYFGQNNSYANGTGSFNQTFSTATAAFTGLSGEFMPCFVTYGGADIAVNFGQRPFTYTPPTGYVRLNTFNLPTPTIGATASELANEYFDATLYTGNGSTQTITNSGSMQPDWVWYKGRSTTFNHGLFDSIRGTLQRLSSNLTSAESTTAGSLTAFNSNGFSVGSDAGANQNTDTYVAWQWRASNATAVTNTAGSITSTVSANTTAGFSIVTYTANNTAGATIGHGLGVVPSMIIVKCRNNANSWNSYHISLGNTKGINLNDTAAEDTSSNYWNNTTPTSSVFTTGIYTNNSTFNFVAYCFAQVAGYSAFGSYTGNGSTDGPFVFTGFRPRYLLWKATNVANQSWLVIDSTRNPSNVLGFYLFPNLTDAEGSTTVIDFLSNGFKLRAANAGDNQSGGTYIYMAFAENPFKYANAR